MSADTAGPPSTPPNLRKLSQAAARTSHRSETPLPALDSLSLREEPSDSDALSTTAQPDGSPDMAATAGFGDWQRSASLSHSSDTVSPIYPDRLIRPLPKRKLRSRLSEGQAGSITYPPNVSSSSSVFGSPSSQTGHINVFHYGDATPAHHDDSVDENACGCADEASDGESEGEDGSRNPGSWLPRNGKLHAHSSTSSADGYESFENTNNKKKRKIPVAGSSSMAGGPDVMATDVEHVVSDPRRPMGDGSGESASPSSLGPGFGKSGAGRGRYGRQPASGKSERRPLGPSHSGSNSTSSGNRMKRDWNAASAQQSPDGDRGIISAAIASAGKKNLALNAKGQENVSLLQRQQASAGKDFTFECKSNSSNKMALTSAEFVPSQARPPPPLDPARTMATQGTQTSRHPPPQSAPGAPHLRRQPPSSAPSQPAPAPAPRPRRPRRPDQEYAAAARQRQMQQDLNNYHHPPRREDIWICEFCEYEAIWGKPPVQLVRDYEKKDRRERKAAEERRRLLEKAKAKSRKNRKGGKGSGKHASAPPPPNQPYDEHYDDHMAPHDQDSQGEEFFEDDYDDEGRPPGHLGYEEDAGYEDPYSPPLGPVHNGHAVPPVPATGPHRH